MKEKHTVLCFESEGKFKKCNLYHGELKCFPFENAKAFQIAAAAAVAEAEADAVNVPYIYIQTVHKRVYTQ